MKNEVLSALHEYGLKVANGPPSVRAQAVSDLMEFSEQIRLILGWAGSLVATEEQIQRAASLMDEADKAGHA